MTIAPRQHGSDEGKVSAGGIDLILRDLDALPTLPSVAARVLRLAARAERWAAGEGAAVLQETAEIVRPDPSVTARLLALAHEASSRPARTVPQALSVLGCQAARAALLAVRAFDPPGASGAPLDCPAFWRHCIAVACASAGLAGRTGVPIEPAEAFVCGLLHDLGKLALAVCLPKSYRRVVDAACARAGNVAEYERNFIGLDHCVVGRHLARLWNLGGRIENVIWLHHLAPQAIPAAVPDREVIALVGLADALARQHHVGSSGNFTFARTPAEQAAALRVPADVLAEVASHLADEVERHAAACGLAERGRDGSYAAAVAAAGAELGRLSAALGRRAEQAGVEAEAFRRLRRLLADLPVDATVNDALEAMAGAIADGSGSHVVAYALDEAAGRVVCVRAAAPAERASQSLPAAEDLRTDRPPGPDAHQALSALLADPSDLADWADPVGCRHRAFLSAGRWVGGAFVSAADAEADPLPPALADALAALLAIVAQRARAVVLGEQLAAAAQQLAEGEADLVEARSLAAVAEMAAGAAHELNNPLAVVSGRAQLMRERARTAEERKVWQLMAEQAQRISDIITALMEFASPPPPRREAFDLGDLAEQTLKEFVASDAIQAGAVRADMTTGRLFRVRADRRQIRSALWELLANAANAAKADGRVHLTVEADEMNGAVVLAVRDDGPGMDADTLAHAFTPFYSAQPAGRRRGMGLSQAKRNVENNGGRVWITSQAGEGTTVHVALPAAGTNEADEEHDRDREDRDRAGGGR